MRLSLSTSTLIGLLAGCSLATGFPAAEAEMGPERCSDGVDDDLDGKVDCDDPDCAGECTEEGLLRCRDGIDQDGDGLTDYLDPECWAEAEIEVHRCRTVEGFDRTLTLDPAAWTGDGRILEAPDGSPALRAEIEGQYLVGLPVSTGAVDGLKLDVEVWMTERSSLSLTLIPEHADLTAGVLEQPNSLLVTLRSFETVDPPDGLVQRRSITVGPGNDPNHPTATVPETDLPLHTWVGVRITVHAGRPHLWLEENDACRDRAVDGFCEVLDFQTFLGRAQPDLPTGWSATEPLRFGFASSNTATPVFARAPTIHRERSGSCEHEVPQLEGSIVAVARHPRAFCALTRRQSGDVLLGGFDTWQSTDGTTWESVAVIDPPGMRLVDAAIVWDPVEAAFTGVATSVDGRGAVNALHDFVLRECRDFEFSASGLDEELVSDVALDGLALRRGLGIQRTVFVPVSASYSTWFRATPDVDGLHFEPGSLVLPPRPGAQDRLTSIAGQLVATRAFGNRLEVWIERRSGGWLSLPVPLLEPSNIAGTFDQRAVGPAELIMDPLPTSFGEPWEGWLLYTGDADHPGRSAAIAFTVRPRS